MQVGGAIPDVVGVPVVLDGRYELVDLVGSGGMAKVHRGRDLLLRRPVAVKVFHQHLLDDPVTLARARSETRVLARLDHPHLVRLYDASFPGPAAAAPSPYIVMELVDGPTLSAAVRDRPMTPRRAALLGAGLADALAHAHAAGVVHRDVKPANVLLTGDGTAKLADFGIALLGEDPRHTSTGMLVGTAGYLAPEQIRGGAVSGATDVHALGLVVLECLTGTREYPGTGVQAAVARLHRTPSVPEDLSTAWRELLTAMTDDDPALRPTAVAAAVALRALAEDDGTVVVPVVARTAGRRRWAVPVAAGVVVLGALGAVLGLGTGGAAPQAPVTAGTPLLGTTAAATSSVAPVPAAVPAVVDVVVTPDATTAPATTTTVAPTTTSEPVAEVAVQAPVVAAPEPIVTTIAAVPTTTAAPTTTAVAGPGNGNGNGPGGGTGPGTGNGPGDGGPPGLGG